MTRCQRLWLSLAAPCILVGLPKIIPLRCLRSFDIHVDLQPELSVRLFESFIAGLDDYTTDQRGDVGSWLRMSSIRGAVSVIQLYLCVAQDLQPLDAWLPSKLYDDTTTGIFKQAAERLDNVRQVAVDGLVGLLQCETPQVDNPGRWRLEGEGIIRHELIDLCAHRFYSKEAFADSSHPEPIRCEPGVTEAGRFRNSRPSWQLDSIVKDCFWDSS